MSFAGVAINSSLSKAGRAAVYIGAPVSGFSSMGQTLYSVGSVEGTVSVSPNQDVVKLYRSDGQNPCHVLETAYDFQVSFNLQEVDLYNLALSLGYKTDDSISATDSLVSATTAITQGDIFAGTMFTGSLDEQSMMKMTLDLGTRKLTIETADNSLSRITTESVVVLSSITSMVNGLHTIEITTPGTGYSENGNLGATDSSGSGSGFEGTYTANSVTGAIETVTIVNPGQGYKKLTTTITPDNNLAGGAVLTPHIGNLQALEDVQLLIETPNNNNSATTEALSQEMVDSINTGDQSGGSIMFHPYSETAYSHLNEEGHPSGVNMGYIRQLADVTQYSSNNPAGAYATTVEFTSVAENFDFINEVGEYIVLTTTDTDNLKPLLGYPLRVTVGEAANKITVDVSDFEVPKNITATNTDTYADSLTKLQLGSDFQAGYRSLLIRVEGGNNSVGGGNPDGEKSVDEWQFFKCKIQSTGSIDYDRASAVTLPVTLHCVANSSDVVGQYISSNDHLRTGTYGDS